MKRDLHLFALWTLAILAAAVVVILYQHAQHTGMILSMIGGSAPGPQSSGVTVDPALTAAPNPGGAYTGQSRASGQWTPTGPFGFNIFPERPMQPGASGFGT